MRDDDWFVGRVLVARIYDPSEPVEASVRISYYARIIPWVKGLLRVVVYRRLERFVCGPRMLPAIAPEEQGKVMR